MMTSFPMIDKIPIAINIHENFFDFSKPGSLVTYRKIPNIKIKSPKTS